MLNCRIAEHFFHVFNLLQEENRKAKDYGNGIPLYNSEVAFLNVIHRSRDANGSQISAALGLTKGAVTQAYQKLGQKGLIEQYKRPDNKKEKYFRLTETGQTARLGYQQFHDAANQQLCDYLSSLSDQQVDAIFDFLGQLKQCVPFCEFPCKCGAHNIMEDEYEQKPAKCLRSTCCAGKRD